MLKIGNLSMYTALRNAPALEYYIVESSDDRVTIEFRGITAKSILSMTCEEDVKGELNCQQQPLINPEFIQVETAKSKPTIRELVRNFFFKE